MRLLLTIQFILSFGYLQAQYMRADQLPAITGEIYSNSLNRFSLDAKENLYYGTSMVDIQNKNVHKEPSFSREEGAARIIYSPNRRYKVYLYLDAFNYPAQKAGRKAPKADWKAHVKAIDWENNQVNGRPYEQFTQREYYDENYPLAITSAGKLITTDPGKVGEMGIYEPEIRHINGLYLFDPRDESRKTITTDKIDTRGVFKNRTSLSADGSCVVLLLNRKHGPNDFSAEVISYHINTGAKTGFTIRGTMERVVVGNNILMSYGYADPETPFKMRIIRINDGKVLGEVGMQGYWDDMNFDMRADTLFYFNAANYTLATFVPGKDEMELQSLLPVDTFNLGLAPVPYRLAVLSNSFALIPYDQPKDHWERRQYSGYMMLFSRKDAAPQLAIKPFFHDPKTAANKLAAENRKYHEACEALKRKTPFTYGTLIRRKTGPDKQTLIFMGPDCVHNNYLVRTAGGAGIASKYLHEFADFEALGPEYRICRECTGSGQITRSFTSANDKWEQVNFNIYVRDKNATKTEYVTSTCRRCVGEGVIKE